MTSQNISLQNALRETEERYRALLENSCEGIVLVDATAQVLYVSPAEAHILGRPPEESIGKTGFSWVHPDDLPQTQKLFAEAIQSPGETFRNELRIQHKNGEWRWIECAARNLLNDPAVGGIVINYHDITVRKLQEQEAQRQKERFEIISRATHDVVWDWNLETDVLWWNQEFYHRFGYSTDIPPTIEFWEKNLHPDDVEWIHKSLKETFAGERNYWTGEYRFRHANGEYIEVLDRGSVMRNADGKPVRMLGTLMDISERKKAEAKSQMLAAFVQYNPNPVFEFSATGGITYFNAASERLARLVGKTDPLTIIPAEVSAAVKQCLQTGEPKLELISSINARTIAWWLYPLREFKVVHCYASDISDKIKLEEQVRHASKMEAIGQLAGGVAHDFNNILTVIEGHAALLETDNTLKGNSAESIQEITLAAERASNLTRQLLTFSRKQVMQLRNVNCNDVVHNITRMLHRILGEDVQLQVNYGPNLPCIHADPGMLEQVLVNLAVNSRDAMPHGGKLTIETSVQSVDAAYQAANPESTPGQAVCLSVTDSGVGIPAEHLTRIFEPFFTTKEVGKGTGLGLATVYGIVKQHKGWLTVQSEVGHGTTFKIFLPAGALATSTKEKAPKKTNVRGTETILLVEDEFPVRKLTRNVLELYGYTVLEAATGKEAWTIWEQNSQKIHLILTDMVMPEGMSGRELVEKIRSQRKEAKAIFVSGYSSDFCEKESLLHEGINFLQKPYHPQELGEAIRRCLNHQSL